MFLFSLFSKKIPQLLFNNNGLEGAEAVHPVFQLGDGVHDFFRIGVHGLVFQLLHTELDLIKLGDDGAGETAEATTMVTGMLIGELEKFPLNTKLVV